MTAFHTEAARGNPELALMGAIIHRAMEDAGEGDASARRWLGSDACRAVLMWLCPDGSDPEVMQRRILDALSRQEAA